MTTYAIGDVRGNYQTLLNLLQSIQYDQQQDTLWFTGNLVNGGSESLEVLRFVKDLGKQAVTVLGNQELRLVGVADGVIEASAEDTFHDVLSATDSDALLKWICQLPFLHNDLGFTLVHAGIPAEWSLSQAQTFAMEVESTFAFGNRQTFLENIFADDPTRWHAKHRGWKRARFITNAFTRMRYVNENGRLDFGSNGEQAEPADGYLPWYRQNDRAMARNNIIFGHWPLEVLDNNQNTPFTPGIFPLNGTLSDLATETDALCAMKLCSKPELINIPRVKATEGVLTQAQLELKQSQLETQAQS